MHSYLYTYNTYTEAPRGTHVQTGTLWLVGGGKVEGKAAAIVKMQPTSHSYTLKLQKQQNRIIYFYDDKNLFPSYAENARIMHFVCRDIQFTITRCIHVTVDWDMLVPVELVLIWAIANVTLVACIRWGFYMLKVAVGYSDVS